MLKAYTLRLFPVYRTLCIHLFVQDVSTGLLGVSRELTVTPRGNGAEKKTTDMPETGRREVQDHWAAHEPRSLMNRRMSQVQLGKNQTSASGLLHTADYQSRHLQRNVFVILFDRHKKRGVRGNVCFVYSLDI